MWWNFQAELANKVALSDPLVSSLSGGLAKAVRTRLVSNANDAGTRCRKKQHTIKRVERP